MHRDENAKIKREEEWDKNKERERHRGWRNIETEVKIYDKGKKTRETERNNWCSVKEKIKE